jgi:hypothetical protein
MQIMKSIAALNQFFATQLCPYLGKRYMHPNKLCQNPEATES